MLALGFRSPWRGGRIDRPVRLHGPQPEPRFEDQRLAVHRESRFSPAVPKDKELKAQGPGLQLRDYPLQDEGRPSGKVWAGKDRLVASTPDAPETPLSTAPIGGESDATIAGITWKVLSISRP